MYFVLYLIYPVYGMLLILHTMVAGMTRSEERDLIQQFYLVTLVSIYEAMLKFSHIIAQTCLG